MQDEALMTTYVLFGLLIVAKQLWKGFVVGNFEFTFLDWLIPISCRRTLMELISIPAVALLHVMLA